MVDINLLDDEDSPRNRPSDSEFQEPYDFEEPSEENEEISEDETWDGSDEDDSSYGGYESPRSKTLLYVVIPLVIIAVFAAIYIWQPFFKKESGPDSTEMTEIGSSEGDVAETGEEDLTATPPVTAQAQPTSLAQSVETLIASIPSGERLSSFSYSSGKFYLQLDVTLENTLQEFYQELKGIFPDADVTLRTRRPSSSGNLFRGLYTGSFEKQAASTQTYGLRAIDAAEFTSTVNTFGQTAGLMSIQVTSSPQTRETDVIRIPTRVVAQGRITGVNSFLRKLFSEGISIYLSRIIITPSRGGPESDEFIITANIDLLQSR